MIYHMQIDLDCNVYLLIYYLFTIYNLLIN